MGNSPQLMPGGLKATEVLQCEAKGFIVKGEGTLVPQMYVSM